MPVSNLVSVDNIKSGKHFVRFLGILPETGTRCIKAAAIDKPDLCHMFRHTMAGS